MDRLLAVLIVLSALNAGLVAGVFYAFSTFVMRALHLRPAAEGIAAMQSINVVVLNPKFLGCFVGTVPLGTVAAVGATLHGPAWTAGWTVAGAALYCVGCFGVTIGCNVPLNNVLATIAPDAPDAAARWDDYVRRWTAWNHVRTTASLAASAAFILAIL